MGSSKARINKNDFIVKLCNTFFKNQFFHSTRFFYKIWVISYVMFRMPSFTQKHELEHPGFAFIQSILNQFKIYNNTTYYHHLQSYECWIWRNKSLIKMFKGNGPNIGPWGISRMNLNQYLYEDLTLVLFLRLAE